tara:strand:- start:372 stop:686 length:315 start_codon:yes stop_codon:yes gene_type:complete
MPNKLAIQRVVCPCDSGEHRWAQPGKTYSPGEFRSHCAKHYHKVFMYDYEKELWIQKQMEYESIVKRLKAKLKYKNKKLMSMIEDNYKLIKGENIPIANALDVN